MDLAYGRLSEGFKRVENRIKKSTVAFNYCAYIQTRLS